jgi:hypothetical protein
MKVTEVLGVLRLYHLDVLLLELLERLLGGLIKKLEVLKELIHRFTDRLKSKRPANKQPIKQVQPSK